MRRLAIALLAGSCLSSACKRNPLPAKSDGGERAEVRFRNGAESDEDEGPKIGFRIAKIHVAQHPTKAARWHEAGGDWTFYDAKTEEGVPFGFGIHEGRGYDKLSFGDAMLTVPDAAAGAKIVEHFAR